MEVAESQPEEVPTLEEVQAFWRRNGLKPSSIAVYSLWVRRFIEAFRYRDEPLVQFLTLASTERFARRYARKHQIDPNLARSAACNALHACSAALSTLGVATPSWQEAIKPQRLTRLLVEYLEYRRIHSGTSASRDRRDVGDIGKWLRFLARRRKSIDRVRLKDVDDYLIILRERLAVATASSSLSSIRQFLRFLHVTGRMEFNIAESVQAPRRRPRELPRALDWSAVQKILRCVDRATPVGKRDYAVLLLMSLYGLGAAEIVSLLLENLDWTKRSLTIIRPKTGATIVLPLKP